MAIDQTALQQDTSPPDAIAEADIANIEPPNWPSFVSVMLPHHSSASFDYSQHLKPKDFVTRRAVAKSSFHIARMWDSHTPRRGWLSLTKNPRKKAFISALKQILPAHAGRHDYAEALWLMASHYAIRVAPHLPQDRPVDMRCSLLLTHFNDAGTIPGIMRGTKNSFQEPPQDGLLYIAIRGHGLHVHAANLPNGSPDTIYQQQAASSFCIPPVQALNGLALRWSQPVPSMREKMTLGLLLTPVRSSPSSSVSQTHKIRQMIGKLFS